MHRSEMTVWFSVRARRDSARTWDYAITNTPAGAEKRVYIHRKSRCGADPSLCIAASSDLQPAILEPRVRGTESATRQRSDKLSRLAGISSSRAVRGGVGRTGHPCNTFKTIFLNYSPPIQSLHRDWLTHAEDISGGPNMTVQCKG